jgi:hypothetical protein
MVTKLSNEVSDPNSDNADLKQHIKDLWCLLDRPFGLSSQFKNKKQFASGSLASQSVAKSYKGVVSNPHRWSAATRIHRTPKSSVPSTDARSSSYKDVASAGLNPEVCDGPIADSYNPEVISGGFVTVTVRKMKSKQTLNTHVKKNRTPVTGAFPLSLSSPKGLGQSRVFRKMFRPRTLEMVLMSS